MKLAVILAFAAASSSSSLPMPDYASYDMEGQLAPYLPYCADALSRAVAGEPDGMDALIAALPPEQGARMADVCGSFFIGAAYLSRLQAQTAGPGTAI